MYYSLTGKLLYSDPQFAVVDCNGVGYKCYITLKTLASLPAFGEEVTLYTHLNVREDALDLYGFITQEECQMFRRLTGVSGVGPKSALAILSDMTPSQLAICITTGDAKALSRAPGIGPKAAQRLILELRDKITKDQLAGSDLVVTATHASDTQSNMGEAVSALCALGYGQSEAVQALVGASPEITVEELIKMGLRKLSSRK